METTIKCPKCQDGMMKLRTGPHGQFWGCDQYPTCKHTEQVKDKPVEPSIPKLVNIDSKQDSIEAQVAVKLAYEKHNKDEGMFLNHSDLIYAKIKELVNGK